MADSRKQEKADSPEQTAREEKPETPREAVAAAEPAEDSEKISVERLIEYGPQYVGQPGHVVAGALHGVNRKNLTVEETKAAVDAWLKSPVKQED